MSFEFDRNFQHGELILCLSIATDKNTKTNKQKRFQIDFLLFYFYFILFFR